jgi:hypothetical protein
MGDVSHAVPAIHPWLAICDEGETLCHEHRFLQCAASERGFDTMRVAAQAMARTTLDLMEDGALLAAVKQEWSEAKR